MHPDARQSRVVGRYALSDAIASGGMASVHLGRLIGPIGFARVVAIKRLHPHFATNDEFVAMFMDEARVAARVFHPNVVPTLDVIHEENELLLVMEYVRGESLSTLARLAENQGTRIPPRVAVAIVIAALHGLHAAHEAKDETGAPLGIIHRDVSPQNILVGADGVARMLDFGVAKAAGRCQTTQEGQVKGKLAYMPPEQVRAAPLDRRADIYSMAVVLWEALAGRRLFAADTQAAVLSRVLHMEVPKPSSIAAELSPELDAIAMRGLAREPNERFASAREMAQALERCSNTATQLEVAEWVEGIAAEPLSHRAARVARLESATHVSRPAAVEVESRAAVSSAASSHSPPSSSPIVAFGPPSVGTDISLATVTEKAADAAPRAPKLKIAIASAAATAVAAVALIVATTGDRGRSEGSASSIHPATAVAANNSTTPPPASARAEPEEIALDELPLPSPVASAEPAASAAGPARSTPKAKPRSKSRCMTVDSNGIWHVKPECL